MIVSIAREMRVVENTMEKFVVEVDSDNIHGQSVTLVYTLKPSGTSTGVEVRSYEKDGKPYGSEMVEIFTSIQRMAVEEWRRLNEG